MNEIKMIHAMGIEYYKYDELVKYSKELQDYENTPGETQKILDGLDSVSHAVNKIIEKWYQDRVNIDT